MILMAAGAAVAHLALAQPATVAAHAAEPPRFDGAVLGMTIGEWRALAPPPGTGPNGAPDCGPAVAAAVGRAVGGGTICSYDARFGKDVLLHSAQLDGHDRIDDLSYRFRGGRLGELDFSASIDAYNDIDAMLRREYGPPVATLRDTVRTSFGRFDRVRQTWRASGGVVRLTDPGDNPLRLDVRMTAAPAGN